MSVVPILMYHSIADPPPGAGWPVLYVRPVAFRRQVAILRGLGYHLVTMSEALPVLRGETRERVAVLTFDDAYVDVYENALPTLCAAGARATVYAVSACLGGFNAWDDEKVGVRKALMTAQQLRECASLGMEVGAHTRTHPRLPTLGPAALRDEIAGSRAELEDALGLPVTQFCYPYGEADESTFAAVMEAGFQAATTTRRGRAAPGDDLMRLPRIPVKRQLPLALFPFRVVTSYEDRRG